MLTLGPRECWVALYGHEVSHHSSCRGHVPLLNDPALSSLKSWKMWTDSSFFVLEIYKRLKRLHVIKSLTVCFYRSSPWDFLRATSRFTRGLCTGVERSASLPDGRNNTKLHRLIKSWHDLNTNSYFSELPWWGSYNNEPCAGPKFLQILL